MWTSEETRFLRKNCDRGAGAIALHLGRSEVSVRVQAHRLGISLRRPGCRRGNVLGQPKGSHLTPELRELLLTCREDPRAARRRRDALPLCPRCVSRAATDERTGLCKPCQLHELAEAHREETAELLAKRERAGAA